MPRPLLSFLLTVCVSACVSLEELPDEQAQGGLRTAELGGMSNVSVGGNIWMGCLADAKDIGIAGRRGIATVIDLRGSTEEVDIASWCEAEDIEYLRLSLDPADPDPEVLDFALSVMLDADREGQSILLLSDNGARSAMLFAVHRVIHDNVDLELALEEARRAGMKPGAESVVRQQVRRLIGT